MVRLGDFSVLAEETAAFPRWAAEPVPSLTGLDREMPRVYRQPRAPQFSRGAKQTRQILLRARQAYREGNPLEFGKAYGELCSEFQPAIQWALSCWEYLLTLRGCRFLSRSGYERLYNRGHYRVFTENDFQGLVHRTFKECLLAYLEGRHFVSFERHLRRNLWPRISDNYRALEDPPDPNQRKLTPYSYLRCVPYQFLNRYHHQRVLHALARLPFPLRQAIELYHLSFYREEAASACAKVTCGEFRHRRLQALGTVAGGDPLSHALLRQIERY